MNHDFCLLFADLNMGVFKKKEIFSDEKEQNRRINSSD